MGLRITGIRLSGFRNHDGFALSDLGSLTIIVGRNGIGKTNVLEAIQLLTSASSFRHPQIAQLLREEGHPARIEMDATDGNRRITTALALEPGKKRYTVNGKAKQTADVKGMLPAVTFTPDDLELAKKSSSVKRAALDELGAQLSRNYYVICRDYEKTIRYKNRLLKDEAPRDLIEAIDETLVTCGSQLFCYRRALYGRIVPVIAGYYAEIAESREEFSSEYVESWSHLVGERGGGEVDRDRARELLAEALARHAVEERARRRALVGPHNDKITFTLGGRDAAAFASQGQQRSIVLAWKLAEVELTRQMLGVEPVLLLDDVMSELDEKRRAMLVRFVSEETQTFITATDLSGFDQSLLSRARVVEL